jgi:type VI secretion system protein ImpK
MSRVKIVSHSFLVQNFHAFFALLLRQKEFALRANDGKDPLTLEQQTEEETENLLVNTIQRRLSLLVEEQAIRSTTQAGEFAMSSYQDALYAMVALADEVFLNLPWNGQKHWENNLLESRFFQTQIAGELLFQKIEDLISNNDPMRTDLAVIYLLILGLGFKGKFRGEDSDPNQLALYRQQLYRMVNRHPSTLYDPGREHLIQDCYDHVLDSTISKGLPEIRMWLFVFIGILAAYLFASTILWYKLVKDMGSSISNILHQAQQMGLS